MMRERFGSASFFLFILGMYFLSRAGAASEISLSDRDKFPIKLFLRLEEAVPNPQRPVLLVFFSTDCPVCWDDLFEMKYVVESNDFPVQVVGVSAEKPEYLRPFLEKYSFPYPVIVDRRREIYRRFQVRAEPFKVLFQGNTVLYRDDVLQDRKTQKEKLIQCLRKIASE